MPETRTLISTRGKLAVTTREHGQDHELTTQARWNYQTVKLAADILAAKDRFGDWTPGQKTALLAAIEGEELAPDADNPDGPWVPALTDEAKRDIAAYKDWADGVTYHALAQKYHYFNGGEARKAVQSVAQAIMSNDDNLVTITIDPSRVSVECDSPTCS